MERIWPRKSLVVLTDDDIEPPRVCRRPFGLS
jgi:hypothetical protein